MLVLEYDPYKGEAIPDGQLPQKVLDWQEAFTRPEESRVVVSTENIFTYIRLEIVLGNIDLNHVKFMYLGQEVYVNELGTIPNWPDGFCTKIVDMNYLILYHAHKKISTGGR